MIRVEGLSFAYGRTPVLQDVNLEIRQGEILGIVGPNGCGKSTLLKLLRGQLSPRQGSIRWQDRELSRYPRRALARLVGVVTQGAPVHFPFPVRELAMMGRYARQTGWWGPSAADVRAVERALAVTDTLHLAERPASDLSAGELQRVLLARALAQETPVLLLDEASSHLDLDHRLEMAELLIRLNRDRGVTIVQVSHDLELAAETSQRILLMDADGNCVAIGSPGEVFNADNLRRVFRVEVEVETNPYSGAPRIYSTGFAGNWDMPPGVHVICGGGSGGSLLRRLHVAGCRLTVGPLNQGDTDQELARALGLEMALEQPFCPISAPVLAHAERSCRSADVLVVAPTVWGPGNLAGLELAKAALARRQPVVLVDPRPERDFSGGRAWSALEELIAAGARPVSDLEAALEWLKAADLRKAPGPAPKPPPLDRSGPSLPSTRPRSGSELDKPSG